MKPVATYQKLRGGYYTPKPIADFLAQWAIQSPTTNVLEPSCGDGILLQSAIETLIACGSEPQNAAELVQGIELDPEEAQKSLELIQLLTGSALPAQIHGGDFFTFCQKHLFENKRFDAIIGNPPFIRYQNFPEEHRQIAFYLMQRAGLHPSRLTNSWVPFLVAATLLLEKQGRLAMVIPAELLQVNYAAELRYFLSIHYSYLTLITFKKLVFDGIQQEVVLLLGEKNGSTHTGIRTIELGGIDDLITYKHTDFHDKKLKEMDHSTEKWTMYFLNEEEIALLRKLKAHPKLMSARHSINVDVGIVTGLNEFFVLNEQSVEEHSLRPYTQRIVGRSAHLPGIRFSEADWITNVENQSPAFLLTSPDVPFYCLPDELKEYVTSGEEKGMHLGYKCRIRNRWYVVPSVWTPHAFMLRQVHQYPKIILNEAEATCTDTIHRIKLRNGTPAQTIAAAFLNSLTFAFSEIMGRSYGGGVLELEPNEAEQLPPPLVGAEELDLNEIDRLLREGNINAALDITDDTLLKKGMGLSNDETLLLRGIWQKLRDRRINRKPDRAAKRL
ncbi:MAG: class I SAM-dependent methyltransferase [Chloroflexota bacterium]|nr:class I SAM-dependent methyltransferase [Chloroflexota bacterium]